MLSRCLQQLGSMSTLLVRWSGTGVAAAAAPLSTSAVARGLEQIIPTFPQEGEQPPTTGRAWLAKDLRHKSWDDLHKLWYVLLLERNRLHSELRAYRQARATFPDPMRLTKVRKSMNRIKQVMSERLKEHEDANVRAQLKAFIDAM